MAIKTEITLNISLCLCLPFLPSLTDEWTEITDPEALCEKFGAQLSLHINHVSELEMR